MAQPLPRPGERPTLRFTAAGMRAALAEAEAEAATANNPDPLAPLAVGDTVIAFLDHGVSIALHRPTADVFRVATRAFHALDEGWTRNHATEDAARLFAREATRANYRRGMITVEIRRAAGGRFRRTTDPQRRQG